MVDWPDERTVGVLLYPHFDLLDVSAPLHAFGMLKGVFDCVLLGLEEGPIASTQGPSFVAASTLREAPPCDILMIPGGAGSRELIRDEESMSWIQERAGKVELILTLSTGSVVVSTTGLLDGRSATTSTRAMKWARETAPRVAWQSKARWVDEGEFVTAAGVGTALDTTLHVISRLTEDDVGDNIARSLEHVRIRDAAEDPFA